MNNDKQQLTPKHLCFSRRLLISIMSFNSFVHRLKSHLKFSSLSIEIMKEHVYNCFSLTFDKFIQEVKYSNIRDITLPRFLRFYLNVIFDNDSIKLDKFYTSIIQQGTRSLKSVMSGYETLKTSVAFIQTLLPTTHHKRREDNIQNKQHVCHKIVWNKMEDYLLVPKEN